MNVLEVKAALAAAVWPCAPGGGEAAGSASSAAGGPAATCGGPGALPPHGNTGGKLTAGTVQGGNDWLNVTFPIERLQDVRAVVCGLLGPSEDRDRGANTYKRSAGWETGCVLAWSPADEDGPGRGEAWLSMNGDSCDMIAPAGKLPFFRQLRDLGAKCTRIDAKLDVARDLVTMDEVHAAAAAGHVVGFKRYDPRRARDMYSGDLDEDQARFGSRGKNGAGRYVRVYDKALESDGEIDCIRFEAELSGDVAAAWFALLCDSDDTHEFARILGRMVTSSIGFYDKSGAHNHRDRFAILPWWDRLVKLVACTATIATSRVRPSLETTIGWMRETMPRAVARIVHALDCQGMNGAAVLRQFVFGELLKRGEKKLQFRPAPLLDQGIDVRLLFSI